MTEGRPGGPLRLKKDVKAAKIKKDRDTKRAKSTEKKAQPLREVELAADVRAGEQLTPAEKAFRIAKKHREASRIQKKVSLTHRERVEKLNQSLSLQTERGISAALSRRLRHSQGRARLEAMWVARGTRRVRFMTGFLCIWSNGQRRKDAVHVWSIEPASCHLLKQGPTCRRSYNARCCFHSLGPLRNNIYRNVPNDRMGTGGDYDHGQFQTRDCGWWVCLRH